MTYPAAFWPGLLGISFLIAGLIVYRREWLPGSRHPLDLTALGPVFVGASLAAFAGEHFSAAATLAQIVPKWMPGRLFIAYFVGVAHLAAASSFVARRYVRWSAPSLALMFALFVLLMDLPGALARPAIRMSWSLAARETTFSIGALALFATATMGLQPKRAAALANIARIWTAIVLVFYGVENLLFPQFSPGVPDTTPTPAWVPVPLLVAYVTGLLLVACGIAMLGRKRAGGAAAVGGWWMTFLTVAVYVPQWVIAHDVSQQVTAINFVFDTLLFAGMMLVIGQAISKTAAVDGAA